jgi:hypothetical protein
MSQPFVSLPNHLLFKIACCVYMYNHIVQLSNRNAILSEQNRLVADSIWKTTSPKPSTPNLQ